MLIHWNISGLYWLAVVYPLARLPDLKYVCFSSHLLSPIANRTINTNRDIMMCSDRDITMCSDFLQTQQGWNDGTG